MLLQASWWEGLVPALWWVQLGLVPLVGRTVSRGMFIGSCGFRLTLYSLSADGGTVFPPYWWFGLRCLSTGARSQCQIGDFWERSLQ